MKRLSLVVVVVVAGCGDDGGSSPQGDATTSSTAATSSSTASSTATSSSATGSQDESSSGGEPEDLDMTPEDFACLLQLEKVRRFRITNLLGKEAEALAVANDPEGNAYPVGTVIQLVPTEAMVKRAAGWSPPSSDWEFFFLDVSAEGTEIAARGVDDVVNGFGLNCFNCHSLAEPQWDFVCEQDHGCDDLPLTEELIDMLQQSDPRCG